MNYLALILTALNVFPGAELRGDSKFTAILSRELEFVKARTYDVVYPAFKARRLIPVSNEVDSGAETITYQQWDGVGMAQIISNYADDIPMVEVLAEEFTSRVYGMALGFTYSIQELRRAARNNSRLSQRKARFTRRGVEQKIENIAVSGEPGTGMRGLANNPNVTIVAPITGNWATATGAQMVDDLLNLCAQVPILNKDTFEVTTVTLDNVNFRRMQKKRMSTTGDSDTTALEAFKKSYDGDIEVESWTKLNNQDAAGTGPRIIAYAKDRDVMELEIPQEYEQFPPQQSNLAFKVPAHARIGGVSMYYPLAVAYMDGC